MTLELIQETREVAGTNGRPDPSHYLELELSGIVKRWHRQPTPVLNSIDFVAEPGTSTWIGGANGVGKTTLLRIVTGAILPDSGKVWFGATSPEIDRRAFHRHISYLAAGNANLYARLSVRRHLNLWGCLAFLNRSERKAAIARVIEHFDLEALANRRCDRLSLGQRQRVRLAGTFLHDPDLLVLDEPHTSLDQEGLDRLSAACADVVARGGVMVWCSPAIELEKLHSDRHFILEDGRLREQ